MANVAHSGLTGTDLHESKGVAAATANKVYVTDGAGSGSFVATSTFNVFGNQLFHLQDNVSSGTNGAALTNSAWTTRRLQTSVTNEISSASLASNQITLPAGTFYISAELVIYFGGSGGSFSALGKLRFRNITAGSTTLSGTGIGFSESVTAGVVGTLSASQNLSGRFTLAGSTVFEIQNYTSSSGVTSLGGVAISSGENEVYANVMIWKTA